MGEGWAESIQQWCMTGGDEVPVRGADGCLGYRLVREGRMNEELWEVNGWGAGRVACE